MEPYLSLSARAEVAVGVEGAEPVHGRVPLQGDFATGVRTLRDTTERGDFATGIGSPGTLRPTGDFSTGALFRGADPLPTGDFATGSGRHRWDSPGLAGERGQGARLAA